MVALTDILSIGGEYTKMSPFELSGLVNECSWNTNNLASDKNGVGKLAYMSFR